ncbi:MAG: ATP-binding protein [Gammaproteobacteria bacterium]
MFIRHLKPILLEALADSPVVLINGARQTGKSTLAQSISQAQYLTFDDIDVLSAAKYDPQGFIAGLNETVVLDEIQRVPELFLAIKASVDRQRIPGRFLLTGSANILLLPKLAESLAGRMEIQTLWPLSQAEITNTPHNFIDALFAGQLVHQQFPTVEKMDIAERITRGGYPAAYDRANENRRATWFESYITAILQRDIRDLANIEGLTEFPRLLALLASRSASLLNFAELSRSIGIAQTTLKRYLILLETTFLIRYIPAFSSNLGKRTVKSPKLYLNDTGLMAHLNGSNKERLFREPLLWGSLLETFVQAELIKHLGWSVTPAYLMHYRTQTGIEVDFILENRAGNLIGIEVKASATITAKNLNGLRHFMELTKEKFQLGIVLYTGNRIVPFGEKLFAIPISALWR